MGTQNGLGNGSSWRKTSIFRGPRTESNRIFGVSYDRRLCESYAASSQDAHASFVWCVPLYGDILSERSTIVRSYDAFLHPAKVPTGLLVPSSRPSLQSSPLHFHSAARTCSSLDHKVH